VYGILSAQLALTVVVALLLRSSPASIAFVQRSLGLQITAALLPFVLLPVLYCYRQQHPVNLYVLGGFTLT
jgi:FtsH-binding integral membrane protein